MDRQAHSPIYSPRTSEHFHKPGLWLLRFWDQLWGQSAHVLFKVLISSITYHLSDTNDSSLKLMAKQTSDRRLHNLFQTVALDPVEHPHDRRTRVRLPTHYLGNIQEDHTATSGEASQHATPFFAPGHYTQVAENQVSFNGHSVSSDAHASH